MGGYNLNESGVDDGIDHSRLVPSAARIAAADFTLDGRSFQPNSPTMHLFLLNKWQTAAI